MHREMISVLKDSYEHLHKKNPTVYMNDLENEIISLASYVFLRGSTDVDFNLDYLDKEAINSFERRNIEVANKFFAISPIVFQSLNYTLDQAHKGQNILVANLNGVKGYAVNLKAYFIEKHKIPFTIDRDEVIELQLNIFSRYDELIDAKDAISEDDFSNNDVCLQTAMFTVNELAFRQSGKKEQHPFQVKDYILELLKNPNTRNHTLKKTKLYFEKSLNDLTRFIEKGKADNQLDIANRYLRNTKRIVYCLSALL